MSETEVSEIKISEIGMSEKESPNRAEINVQEHAHTHDPKEIKVISNRLAKAIGHLQAVKGMVESGRDCSEVLVQLAAVKSALNNTGKLILKEHISHCIVHAIENGDHHAIDQLNRAIDQFVK